MGVVHETAVSVGFHGDDLEPNEITRLLGASPDAAHRKGDLMHNGKPWLHGLWSRQVPRSSPGDLDAQIMRLLASLSDDLAVWRDLSRKFRGRIFCGLFLDDTNQGLSLSPECLGAIADRGLILDFDIYALGED